MVPLQGNLFRSAPNGTTYAHIQTSEEWQYKTQDRAWE